MQEKPPGLEQCEDTVEIEEHIEEHIEVLIQGGSRFSDVMPEGSIWSAVMLPGIVQAVLSLSPCACPGEAARAGGGFELNHNAMEE